jgi:hypothetical protein
MIFLWVFNILIGTLCFATAITLVVGGDLGVWFWMNFIFGIFNITLGVGNLLIRGLE